ncbi:unnamed protein product, partial [Timema podura]|nr:unnamed protein product [Timema podura]
YFYRDIGLVEQEWLDTLATINPDEVTFLDYIEVGRKLGAQLKEEGCDYVIALTHMRTPNDIRLAENVNEIDLILGGHDHVYEIKQVHGKYIIKSGTDFRQFSKVTLSFDKMTVDVSVEEINVTSSMEEDSTLKLMLEQFTVDEKTKAFRRNFKNSNEETEEQYRDSKKRVKQVGRKARKDWMQKWIDTLERDVEGRKKVLYSQVALVAGLIEGKMDDVLGSFTVPLDGRFESVRRGETNLGNWVCDVVLACTGADLVIMNSGTLRSDTVHAAGPFTLRDLVTVIPMMDPLVVLSVTGQDILNALENGVSQYPKLEGRFPQVAGISFAFDPQKPKGKRVDPNFVRIGDEYLVTEQRYRLATKTYLQSGCDGYTMLKDAKVLLEDMFSKRTTSRNYFFFWLNTTGALANYATEAGKKLFLARHQKRGAFVVWPPPVTWLAERYYACVRLKWCFYRKKIQTALRILVLIRLFCLSESSSLNSIQVDQEECPELGLAVQNHFKAIDMRLGKTRRHSKHRQSLVTLSRRHSLIKMLDTSTDLDGPPPLRRSNTMEVGGTGMRHSPPQTHPSHSPHSTQPQRGGRLMRRASLDDLEQESCQLSPKLEGRIVLLTDEKREELLLERQRLEEDSVIQEVDDECSPQGSIDQS